MYSAFHVQCVLRIMRTEWADNDWQSLIIGNRRKTNVRGSLSSERFVQADIICNRYYISGEREKKKKIFLCNRLKSQQSFSENKRKRVTLFWASCSGWFYLRSFLYIINKKNRNLSTRFILHQQPYFYCPESLNMKKDEIDLITW